LTVILNISFKFLFVLGLINKLAEEKSDMKTVVDNDVVVGLAIDKWKFRLG
jgi:hypothetical protein